MVVVDDGSRDRAALDAALARHARRRAACTPAGAGPAVARNLGAEAARGDVICFTDDDCEPTPGWAGRLAAAAGSTGVAAGPDGGAEARRDAGARLAGDHRPPAGRVAGRERDRPLRAHAATSPSPATLFARLRFDERFPDAAGEDREWSARAVATGVAAALRAAAAVTVHRQRLDAVGFVRQQYRYGRGAARFRRLGPRRRRGLAAPSFYADLVRAGFDRGPLVGALVIAAQVATAAGIAAEAAATLARRGKY